MPEQPDEMTDDEVLANLPVWARRLVEDAKKAVRFGHKANRRTRAGQVLRLCRSLAEARKALVKGEDAIRIEDTVLTPLSIALSHLLRAKGEDEVARLLSPMSCGHPAACVVSDPVEGTAYCGMCAEVELLRAELDDVGCALDAANGELPEYESRTEFGRQIDELAEDGSSFDRETISALRAEVARRRVVMTEVADNLAHDCTCGPAYTDRGMTAPDCIGCAPRQEAAMPEIEPTTGWAIAVRVNYHRFILLNTVFGTRKAAMLYWEDLTRATWRKRRRRGLVKAVKVQVSLLEGE